MACTANHDSGLPQSRPFLLLCLPAIRVGAAVTHTQSRPWCETNFGYSTPLFTCIWKVEELGGGGDGPAEGGFGPGGGGGGAFSFNFNLSNASPVLRHKKQGGT